MGATHGIIAIQTESNLVTTIVSHGGGLMNTGRALSLGYSKPQKILNMISKGKLSFLGVKSLAYIKNSSSLKFNSIEELISYGKEQGINNIYLFDDNRWYMYVALKKQFLELDVILPD